MIQFSGFVYSESKGIKTPVPYAGIRILRTHRGSFSDENGFFSMASQTGDTVLINALGYKLKYHAIPIQLPSENYFIELTLQQDTFTLERAIVYPIPSKEHFKQEFLQMDVRNKMNEIANENLAADVLARIAPGVPSDGRSAVSLYFAQEAQKAYYDGQIKPQLIFSPIAWIEFFKALKRGDFKKKKKKEPEKK
ncbi:MAG: carboxypeptidase-like regulatory domain-containing protein [Saprospiraceae bacterium]|nr:carboxypeptidase-like regulatory domain-containing protein [Saprospiraceae bacterium]MBK9222489.1 carboxypeptidase-like regulatory domain-containing protein [Saprospiraceae bacterium]MBK9727447.1 carboxypeptidase-like regulatory domain-containing protein [Saprospiraceae bacterium]